MPVFTPLSTVAGQASLLAVFLCLAAAALVAYRRAGAENRRLLNAEIGRAHV